jgi:hypothetical protein
LKELNINWSDFESIVGMVGINSIYLNIKILINIIKLDEEFGFMI